MPTTSGAITSMGMLLKRGDGASPEVFTTVPDVQSISGPGGTATEIDVTHLDSAAKEIRMGLQDFGSLTVEIAYIPNNAQHEGLLTDMDGQTERNFTLTFTDSPASTWSFAAFVLGFELSNAVDDVTRATVTLRVTGTITRT